MKRELCSAFGKARTRVAALLRRLRERTSGVDLAWIW
jgi:hypothetical protein